MIINSHMLDEANYRVTLQLRSVGLYCAGMANVVTRLVPFGLDAYGWKYRGRQGEIHVPRVSLARWRELFGEPRVGLRDVLRHEFGHALVDLHPRLFRTGAFREAFGASVSAHLPWQYHPDHHITPYAATSPEEDFCETFMVWLKHGGNPPLSRTSESIRRKFKFSDSLSLAFSSSGSSR